MKTKILCKILGGSQLYHLSTPESDVDIRGVFTHTDPAYILGTRRFDETRRQNLDEDTVVKELSHYCNLLSKSNTEALELLFCNISEFTEITPEFRLLRDYRFKFIDSKKLFGCLRGYMQGERRLMNGAKPGEIGGKRYKKLQEVGYSPKNAVQLMRLANVGRHFFETGEFVVNTEEFGIGIHSLLLEIKTEPERFSKSMINEFVDRYETALVEEFESRRESFAFDEDTLNEVLMAIYMPILKNYKNKS